MDTKMFRMVSSVSWIPKGAVKVMLDAAEPPSKEEMKEFILNGTLKKSTLRDEEEMEDAEVAHAKAVAKSLGKSCSKSNGASTSSSNDPDEVVKFMKELDMDNYDDEDDEIDVFSSGRGDLYYPSNDMDPYLNHNIDDEYYDSDDIDAITIKATDSLIICARVEGEINFLEVYKYDGTWNDTEEMYPRQDIILSNPPLCTTWLDCPLKGADKCNFVAIGLKGSPTIEIWDLDVANEVLPCVQLGAGQTSDCNTDQSVIDLSWNKEFRNIIASASADTKVKVWDVATGQCKHTLEHHTEAVQAVEWNHYAPQVLLSGSYDCTVVLKDGRDPSHSGLKWSTNAKVESLAWDPHNEHSFVVCLEDGKVKGFDIRASDLSPSFTLDAHVKEVSSISYNTYAPNLLATGSKDKSVKLWDLSSNQPSCIATHYPNAGRVFSVSFSTDCPFLLAIGARKGKLNVWDTLSNTVVSQRYGSSRP